MLLVALYGYENWPDSEVRIKMEGISEKGVQEGDTWT
jgi:hypothetical protein